MFSYEVAGGWCCLDLANELGVEMSWWGDQVLTIQRMVLRCGLDGVPEVVLQGVWMDGNRPE